MAVNTYQEYTRNYLVNNKAITDVIFKFGRNAALTTSFTPVSIGGIYRTPQASAATKLRVKAGNANDTAGGSGARAVYIEGLDETGARVNETLATAGESASANTANDYIRIFRAYVTESGTYATSSAGSHSAAIVIENSAGTEDWLTIDAASFPKGQSEIGVFTVPLGSNAFILESEIFVDASKPVDVLLFQRQGILDSAAPYDAMRTVRSFIGVTGPVSSSSSVPLGPFPELTDIGFMAKGATTPSCSVDFTILLMDNSA